MTTLEIILIFIIIAIYLLVAKITNEILMTIALMETLLTDSNPNLFPKRKLLLDEKRLPYMGYVWPLLFWNLKFNK